MHRSPSNPPDAVERAVAILRSEFRRQSRFLSYDDVARVVSRRNLDSDHAAAVWARLSSLGIEVADSSADEEDAPEPEQRRLTAFWQDLLPGYDENLSLLSHAEEIRLGRRVRAAELAVSPEGLDEDEFDQERLVRTAREAKDKLILHNCRLVVSIALDYGRRSTLPLEDLFQEGIIGLNRAAEKYDPDRGFRFSTYATWWIRQRITRALQETGRTIRVPSHRHSELRQFRRRRRLLAQQISRKPTAGELAREMGIGIADVYLLEQISRDAASLDKEVGREKSGQLSDLFVGGSPDPALVAEKNELSEIVCSVVDSLDARAGAIIRARFGLDGEIPKTLEELGAVHGVTREDQTNRVSGLSESCREPSVQIDLSRFSILNRLMTTKA